MKEEGVAYFEFDDLYIRKLGIGEPSKLKKRVVRAYYGDETPSIEYVWSFYVDSADGYTYKVESNSEELANKRRSEILRVRNNIRIVK